MTQPILGPIVMRQVQERLLSFGVDRAPIDSPKEFADFLQTDIKRWSQLVRFCVVRSSDARGHAAIRGARGDGSKDDY